MAGLATTPTSSSLTMWISNHPSGPTHTLRQSRQQTRSHEHAGEGGLLEWHDEEVDRMAGNDWKKRDSVNMIAWSKVKASHKKLVGRLLRLNAHTILCFRAEQKIDIVRNKQTGKTEIVPKMIASGFSDWIPIAEKNILYELTASFLLTPDRPGFPQPIKLQEQHRVAFDLTVPITEEAGRRLADWAAGGEKAERAEPVKEEPKKENANVATPQMVEDAAAAVGISMEDIHRYVASKGATFAGLTPAQRRGVIVSLQTGIIAEWLMDQEVPDGGGQPEMFDVPARES